MRNIQLSILEKNKLRDLAKFVVEENFSHHIKKPLYLQSFIEKEIKYIYDEEFNFSNSKTLIAKNHDGHIIGSIRTLKWNLRDILPIEKMFSIRLKNIIDTSIYNVWHIGRFAIKKGNNESQLTLFKTLMTFAISDVCAQSNSIAIAECDIKLLKTLKTLGIEAIPIMDAIHYLGSETVPVILTYNGLKNFYDRHQNLMYKTNEQLHNGVVLSSHLQYYTFV